MFLTKTVRVATRSHTVSTTSQLRSSITATSVRDSHASTTVLATAVPTTVSSFLSSRRPVLKSNHHPASEASASFSSLSTGMVAVALSVGLMASHHALAEEETTETTTITSSSPEVAAATRAIQVLIDANPKLGPTFVRLAWHASGTYCAADNSGGSNGGTIRLCPEATHGANAGLASVAIVALEPIKSANPTLSYADLFILAGVTAIEDMGGPVIPFQTGRTDALTAQDCTPDGRLPDADKGAPSSTVSHIRSIFNRMGFGDREIVALLGAHAIGRCYTDRSGYSGPWTRAEWTFSNEYFRELIENTWTLKKWDGPDQYEDPTGDLMMLPADMALLADREFRHWVELYASDEETWHQDFALAFQKLTENGLTFAASDHGGWGGWRNYWPF